MTNVHDQVLELAAAAMDFDLSPAERAFLETHLAECPSCPRRVAAFEADQRAMFALPRLVPAPGTAAAVRVRVVRRQRLPRSTVRTLAIAAALALLAVTAVAVGSQVVRRLDRDLSDTTPTAIPSLAPADPADIEPAMLTSGSTVDVVVADLRVRTAPTVDDSKSAKLDPLLARGTQLRIVGGPVNADGYDWYQVEAIGWPHKGWVASADHDGSPWIELPSASRPPANLTADEAALIAGLRPDAAIDCRPRRTKLPARATVGVECHVNAAVVIRIGFYGFPTARDAATTYLERLASYGVDPRSGDCRARTEGDRAWQAGDGTSGPATERVSNDAAKDLVVGRIGCFYDENGTANVRVVCGTTSVGLLGRGDDLADVESYAWASLEAERGPGAPPSICPTGT